MVEGMPGRYATALFELALEADRLDEVAGELGRFIAMVDGSKDLERLVKSPVFTPEEQAKAVAAVVEKAGIEGLAANFISLVAGNRRLFAIRDIVAAFGRLIADHRGEETAEVVSAEPLSKSQLDKVGAALEKAVGREVRIDTRVDPAIIGGLVIKVGSRMIDNSLKTKLQNLRIAMREVG